MTNRPFLIVCSVLAFGRTGPEFDAASIKLSDASVQRSYGNANPGKYVARNTPLRFIIEQAYGIKYKQIMGGPEWIDSDGYDFLARAEVTLEETKSARRSDQTHMFNQDSLRLQALLQDRFNLKVHRESRDLPVYALTIAKGGLKIRPPNCVVWDPDHPLAPGQPRPAYCGAAPYEQNRAFFKITAYGSTMENLVRSISTFADRPLVDRTGYTEPFNATLEWYDADSKYASATDIAGPSLFTALHEQLGLRVESTKGPVSVLVIDNIERPSAN